MPDSCRDADNINDENPDTVKFACDDIEALVRMMRHRHRVQSGDQAKAEVQIMKSDEKEENNLNISRKLSTIAEQETTDKVTNEIRNIRSSGGSPLDNETKEIMQSRFGYDFGGVRIHKDNRAAESVQSISALAYTVGQDIVFSPSQYAPSTREGQRLFFWPGAGNS